jgi:hypothetical protein
VRPSRPRRLNAAEAGANQASDLQSLVQLEVQAEQREQHRHHVFMLRRRGSKNMVISQRDDQVRSQIPPKVRKAKFRNKGTSEYLSVSGSARRRLWARLNTGNLAEVHRPDFISRSRVRLVENMRMKRAPNKKECRALTVSRRPLSTSISSSNSSNNNEAVRLPQLSTAKDTGSRKVEPSGNQKKRRRQGRDNFVAITLATPEEKLKRRFVVAAFVSNAGVFVRVRLAQAPYNK